MNRKPAGICLSLTGETVQKNLQILRRFRGACDLLELRADFLNRPRTQELKALPRQTELPIILTIRRRQDGGRFSGTEADRLGLLKASLSAGYRYVDLEEDLYDEALERELEAAGVGVIRSFHDFSGVPSDLQERLSRLPRRPWEIPKAAVMPRSSRDLLRLVRACFNLMQEREKGDAAGSRPGMIVLGMGVFGFPSRVLASRLGSWITYCSVAGKEAAPGHLDPLSLTDLYRFRSISYTTQIFGVIGNPIMHSLSPIIHNRGFDGIGFDGVYLPFQVDDLEAFFSLADLLGIQGLSVTIPHKEAVLAFLSQKEREVQAVGACNTLVRREAGWLGANTDVEGFLDPLRIRFRGQVPAHLGATVLSAGGAARSIVYALRREGVRVLILNRTVKRARELAREFSCAAAGLDAPVLTGYNDLIIQASSVGMSGEQSPADFQDILPGYGFTGAEIVFDIVYAPPITPFLARAKRAGCRIIPGGEMFVSQAKAQFRMFTGRDLPEEAIAAIWPRSFAARVSRGRERGSRS